MNKLLIPLIAGKNVVLKYEGCNFGKFIPDKTEFSLFQTCTKLDTTLCPNCRTSSSIQCDFPGLCFVSMS